MCAYYLYCLLFAQENLYCCHEVRVFSLLCCVCLFTWEESVPKVRFKFAVFRSFRSHIITTSILLEWEIQVAKVERSGSIQIQNCQQNERRRVEERGLDFANWNNNVDLIIKIIRAYFRLQKSIDLCLGFRLSAPLNYPFCCSAVHWVRCQRNPSGWFIWVDLGQFFSHFWKPRFGRFPLWW